ncbi:MAG: hypothetical protein AAFV33_23225 [Chloroflexota bacterium]
MSTRPYTDAGWEDAGDLEPGDLILSLDGDYGVVESVVIVDETRPQGRSLLRPPPATEKGCPPQNSPPPCSRLRGYRGGVT